MYVVAMSVRIGFIFHVERRIFFIQQGTIRKRSVCQPFPLLFVVFRTTFSVSNIYTLYIRRILSNTFLTDGVYQCLTKKHLKYQD